MNKVGMIKLEHVLEILDQPTPFQYGDALVEECFRMNIDMFKRDIQTKIDEYEFTKSEKDSSS